MYSYYVQHPYIDQIRECKKLIENGNLESLKIELESLNSRGFIEYSIECGNIEICKHLCRNLYISDLKFPFTKAADYGKLDILNWIISESYIHSERDFKRELLKFKFNRVNMYLKVGLIFEYYGKSDVVKNDPMNGELLIKDFNLRYNRKAAYRAAFRGNTKKLLWLLDNGFELKVDPGLPKRIRNKNEIIRIFHEYRVAGTNRCKRRFCKFCKVIKMWDLWIMETSEYNSYEQWLHRELVEDLEFFIL